MLFLRPVPPDEASVDPQPQAWRVFDAPGDQSGSADAARADDAGGPVAALPAQLRSPVGIALIAAALLGLVAVAVALGGTPSDGLGPSSSGLGSFDPAGVAGGDLVVDVAGAVARPGVYHLPAGSRVADAIAAAGGFGPRVDPNAVAASLNLAAVVHDGDRVLVPSRDDTPASTRGAASGSQGLVDLNHASAEELDALPGIGPVTAQKIISARAAAPFRAVDDLLTRKLVGQKVFDNLKALVTVG